MTHEVVIYTDGGCSPNPGPGGWGAVVMSGAHKREWSGNCSDTTNNRMELTAAIEALARLTKPCQVTVFTDSQYLRTGITAWLPVWVKRNWRTSAKQPVKNQDLWRALYAQVQRHQVEWHWTKGHAGNEHNERADELATMARLALPSR